MAGRATADNDNAELRREREAENDDHAGDRDAAGSDQTRAAPEQTPPQQHRDQDGRHEHDGELDQVAGPWPLIARATETLDFEERREEATHPRERAKRYRHPDGNVS